MASSSANGTKLDWQMGKINERMKYLLETGVDSDVEFLVRIDDHSEEKKVIKAHKFVLKNSSPIFASQFHESWTTLKNGPIEIKDDGIFASSFTAMLHFIYTDDCSLITSQNIVGVYLAAKKYLLNSLVQKCIELAKPTYLAAVAHHANNYETYGNRYYPPHLRYTQSASYNQNLQNQGKSSIQTILDARNVFDMLQWTKFHKNAINTNNKSAKLDDETILIKYCWEFIDDKIGNFGTATTLLNREEMAELLMRDTLKCEEMTLFNHLNNWAAKQCQNEGIMEPTGDQKRAKMGGLLLNGIRFPLIPPMEFIKKILPTNILSKEEIAEMLLYYTSNVNATPNPTMPFSAKPRAIPPRGYNKLIDYDTKTFNN